MRFALVFFLVVVLGAAAWPAAAELAPEEIPDELRPWIPWVLHGDESFFCPPAFNQAKQRHCAWPSRLELAVDGQGGRFTQTWRVFAETWVVLPGGTGRWPERVEVNGAPTAVMDRGGKPSVRLTAGSHRISGAFSWRRLPRSLPVPAALGLLNLSVDGTAEDFPDLDGKGNLWLRDRRQDRDGGELEDRLVLRVFRHIADDLPMRVTTRLQLEVAGSQREVALEGALLAGFIPLALQSALPARLDPGGGLRLQVRPGSWTVTVTARHPAPVERLAPPAAAPPWPEREIWVFAARNDLRLVEIEGVPAIDPRQTPLPAAWRNLPTYRLGPGEALAFITKRRGDPDPAPDQLQLTRTMWLDFDGDGYTVRDTIRGAMSAGWRLEMNPPFALGRVAVDGQDRFITRAEGSERAGVELRRGQVELVADSRLEGPERRLDAVGWEHDFERLQGVLNLPPGWLLFNASGADSISNTWLQQWTMLDLFLLLVVAVAVARLWDWRWGLLALAAVALVYHEPGAPLWVWLHVLAPVALLRVMPEGMLKRAVGLYRNGALVALVLIALPFAVLELRTAFYPQLPNVPLGFAYSGPASYDNVVAQTAPVAVRGLSDRKAPESELREDQARKVAPRDKLAFYSLGASSALQAFDPGARITTGPGLPKWRWQSVRFRWNGPVERGQSLHLTLIPPLGSSALRLLGVVLIGALTLLMLSARFPFRLPFTGAAPAAALLALSLASATPGPAEAAEIPDKALLDELRTRLLEVPDCFPDCAQVSVLDLEIADGRMSASLSVDAAEGVAVPLPGDDRVWHLRRVELDGAPAEALRRDAQHRLWLHVPAGRHTVRLEGSLGAGVALALPLPLRPQRVTVRAKGWRVEGIDERGVPGAQLQLVRLAGKGAPTRALEPARLPVFARVERVLQLGLEWRTLTRVTRDPASQGAIVLRVPLLADESVTSETVRVEDGAALVNMPPGQREVTWSSTLERRSRIALAAPATSDWTETWSLDASPIWRVRSAGLAPIFHQDPGGLWRPVWRPWPGENLELEINRPQGVEGQTLTIDGSRLRVRPGERSGAATLSLNLRSSQGGQHPLRLPDGARLESVTIDGKLEPVRTRDGTLTLPISPGHHTVEIKWRDRGAVAGWYRTPAFDLGLASVNAEVVLNLPRDRWVLWLDGPRLGPAVLFWPLLVLIAAIAAGLGRVRLTPLGTLSWFLLGLGLTQAPAPIALVVVAWLLALGGRARLPEGASRWLFNLVQVGLVGLTVAALAGLYFAVEQGLLGLPDMQVAGNRSSAYALSWFQDRAPAEPASAAVLSVSIWFYRLAMLAWALWLAFALLGWLRWGWQCFAAGGLWRPFGIHWRARPRADDSESEAEPTAT